MRKLRNRERYVLFSKKKDSPLQGEIPLNKAGKSVSISTTNEKSAQETINCARKTNASAPQTV
ncbi:hypothetical protein C4F40_15585 [Sphingobacterium sp. Ka21]|uniref:DUF1508 domain-containing protein n=1 Tax=Sphingobacterium pedocola TaxID=2082722 RepID=A0ABR9T9Z0_9SPHI|nr:hypothetical protein [Sphingobacterium pedocola]